MKTIYTYNGDLETYFAAAEDFLSDHKVFNEDGTRIVFEGDNALDTYLSYLDRIKELDKKGEYKYLRQPLYSKYFAEAEKLLDDAGWPHNGIYNLSTYFQHLDKIIEMGGPKYLRIPVEEDFFEINTDTREITAPQELAENKWVIGVKDDHLAEILWFRVNRYYDGQDLAVCFPLEERPEDFQGYGQTYIQWKNKTGFGLDVVAHPAFDEDYIYFGWYLRSDKVSNEGQKGVLNVSGDLTFSVRFQFHSGNDPQYTNQPNLETPVLFSFNTKPLTLKVLENLIETISVDQNDGYKKLAIENIADQSYARPRFSTVFDSTDSPKAFIKKDLISPIDLNENNQVTLNVEAQGTGMLKYEWYKVGEPLPLSTEGPEYTIVYDPELKKPVVGTYKVRIGNEDPNTGKTRWTDSDPAVMPGPSDIFIPTEGNIKAYGFTDTSHTLSVTVEKDNDKYGRQTGELSYTWYKLPLAHKENANEKVEIGHDATYTTDLNEIGRYQVEIINYHNGEYSKPILSDYCTLKARPQLPSSVVLEYTPTDKTLTAKVTMANGQDNDLYYKWYKEGNSQGSTFGTNNTLVIKEPGKYYCEVSQKVFDEWAPIDEQTGVNYVSAFRQISQL